MKFFKAKDFGFPCPPNFNAPIEIRELIAQQANDLLEAKGIIVYGRQGTTWCAALEWIFCQSDFSKLNKNDNKQTHKALLINIKARQKKK